MGDVIDFPLNNEQANDAEPAFPYDYMITDESSVFDYRLTIFAMDAAFMLKVIRALWIASVFKDDEYYWQRNEIHAIKKQIEQEDSE